MINTLFNYLQKFSRKEADDYLSKLAKLASEFDKVEVSEKNKLKVLYGPSFGIYPPCYIHDALFSYALRLRGAEIIPIYCDSVQSIECSYCGGVWGGKEFEKNCVSCRKTSENLWKGTVLKPLKFSSYLRSEEVREIDNELDSLEEGKWIEYESDGLPYGKWAKDLLVNMYVVGDYRRIKDHERLGRVHLKNLLICGKIYPKILDEIKPDRVIANDSFYGMWAILQKLCGRRGIPFYSHWSGTRQNSWCYAYNDASMNLDFSRAWKNYSKIPLDERRRKKADEWLAGRLAGKDMILDTASLADYKTDDFDLSKIDAKKPVALLAANVIWDLAALNKQIFFSDMMEWIIETVNWFGRHPEYQLIIKAHPAEQNPSIPETRERVETVLKDRGIGFPENVFFMSPKVKISVYQLFPLAKTGLVFTTTTGIEMAANGIPVITTAKSPYRGFGFTIDPANKDEYFDVLEKMLNGTGLPNIEKQKDLSKKFLLFYNYHYYTKIDFMAYKWGEEPVIKIKSVEELLPGKNKYLDYITESIIDGLPIISEERWPEES